MEDFGPEISLLKTGDYTVKRRASTSYVNGRAVAAAVETFEIEAMVHPVSGQVLARMPEGFRGRDTQAVFTTTTLRAFVDGEPDVVVINGADWQVAVVERWKELGNFFRAYVVRVGA